MADQATGTPEFCGVLEGEEDPGRLRKPIQPRRELQAVPEEVGLPRRASSSDQKLLSLSLEQERLGRPDATRASIDRGRQTEEGVRRVGDCRGVESTGTEMGECLHDVPGCRDRIAGAGRQGRGDSQVSAEQRKGAQVPQRPLVEARLGQRDLLPRSLDYGPALVE